MDVGLLSLTVVDRYLLAIAAALTLLLPSAEAALRSKSARSEFVRQNACPSTGRHRGTCPGFEVDHVTPLCAGGEDKASNMQWLSREDHQRKTRQDVMHCRLRAR